MPNVQALSVINDALFEIGALAQGETASGGDSSFALSRLNQIIDAWNVDESKIVSVDFQQYTLVPNLQPHTIGPSGGGATFTMPAGTNNRPTKIVNSSIILNNVTPNVFIPLRLHDGKVGADWWAANTVRAIATTLPTDLYYSPVVPNGQIFLWPVPTQNYGIDLEIQTALTEYATLATNLNMPPGYQRALFLTLAEDLIAPFQVTDPTLVAQIRDKAVKARGVIAVPNVKSLTMITNDAGIPGGRGSRPNFNWLSGQITR